MQCAKQRQLFAHLARYCQLMSDSPEHIGWLRVTLLLDKICAIISPHLHLSRSLNYPLCFKCPCFNFQQISVTILCGLWCPGVSQEGALPGQWGPYWQTSDTAACSPDNYKLGPFFAFFTDGEIGRNGLADQLDRRNLTEYYGWRINLLSNFVQKIIFNHYACLAQ